MDKSKRKPNFTDIEVKHLLREIQTRPDLLSNDITIPKRLIRDGWEKIEKSFEAISTFERKADELRSKFLDLKSRTKKKIKQIKETGGSHKSLTENERFVLNLALSDSKEEGMFEFVDTFDGDEPATPSPPPSPISTSFPSPRSSPIPSPPLKKQPVFIKKQPPQSSPSPTLSQRCESPTIEQKPNISFRRTKRKLADNIDEQLLEIAKRQAVATERNNVLSEQRNALLSELVDVLKTKLI